MSALRSPMPHRMRNDQIIICRPRQLDFCATHLDANPFHISPRHCDFAQTARIIDGQATHDGLVQGEDLTGHDSHHRR